MRSHEDVYIIANIIGDSQECIALNQFLTRTNLAGRSYLISQSGDNFIQNSADFANTLIFDVQSDMDDGQFEFLIRNIFLFREKYPRKVIIFLADKRKFNQKIFKLDLGSRKRLEHYLIIQRQQSYDYKEVESIINLAKSDIQRPVLIDKFRVNYDFDVAISFAGEDRNVANEITDRLKLANIRVFLDSEYTSEIWGKNLIDYLHGVYSIRSQYCIIIVSEHYARKMWTNLERRTAQSRALKSDQEYILPIVLDNTEIPGLTDSVSYLSINIGIEKIINLFLRKITKM